MIVKVCSTIYVFPRALTLPTLYFSASPKILIAMLRQALLKPDSWPV